MTLESLVAKLFRSDIEATNFSAHSAWSLAVPLLGLAVFGHIGLLVMGVLWICYSFINEFLLHGAEDAREFGLNLASRLVPCSVLLAVYLLRRGT